MRNNSLKTLLIVIVLYFFTNNLSGSFLTVYLRDIGLNVEQICFVLLFTFLTLATLPLALLRIVKSLEKTLSLGIFTTMLFYVALLYSRNPLILGLAQGVSIATFWPSFNLLQLQLSGSKARARTISLLSTVIPSIAGMAGPATGGALIEKFGFTSLFAVSIVLYLTAFVLSTRITHKPRNSTPMIPGDRIFKIFLASFVLAGLTESFWLAYPFFVLGISGTILNMGLVLTAAGILVSIVTFLVCWVSDRKKARVEFAAFGVALSVTWYFLIGFATSPGQIVTLSLLSGLANAFQISWFALLGDSFREEYYASLVMMREVGLAIGRIVNLVPTVYLISQLNYNAYFVLLGAILLLQIPLYLLMRGRQIQTG